MSDARRVYLSLGTATFVVALVVAGHAQDGLPPPPPPPPPLPPSGIFSAGPAPETAPVGTGLILGRVVDAATNRPLSGVLVRLDTGTGFTSTQPTALTNAQGQFLFRSLGPWRYNLSTQFGGYLPGSYGQSRPAGPSGSVRLADGQRLTDVTIRLWRYGAITGRVLDEVGEPAVGLTVRVLRRSTVARQNQWVQGSQATTDDRGIYRLGLLEPGEFVVAMTAGLATVPLSVSEAYMAAMWSGAAVTLPPALQEASASPTGAGTRLGDLQVQPLRNTLPPPPASIDDVLAYQTVYHPSATRLADATRVRVGSGEERTGIDLQARLVKTFRVSGHIRGPDGQPFSAGLTLVPGDAREVDSDFNFETATAVSGADGRFTFLGVPAGPYTIRMMRVPRPSQPAITTTISMPGGSVGMVSTGFGLAGPPSPPASEPTLWAEAPVTVDGHVDNLSVVVQSGARLRGSVEFAGSAAPLDPRVRQLITLSLVAVNGRTGSIRQPLPTRLAADNTFVTSQYPPGRYFVHVSGVTGGWHARSVMVAGKNALEEPFDLISNDLDGVWLTLTNRTTTIAGTVSGASGPSPHAAVLIFPADHDQWIADGMRSTRARTVAAGADGSFHVSGLLPGDYRAVALPGSTPADIQDPATVDALASVGTPVTLAEGETRSVALTVRTLR